MNFMINDFNLYYEKFGSGKTNILILPGWGDNRDTFKNLINELENNFTIYILDYPGFGKSIFPNRDLTIYDYGNLIIDFLKVNDIENPIIIGHSFGGRIAILLSGYYNINIKKIILLGAAGVKQKKSFKLRFRQRTYKFLKKLAYLLPKKKRKLYLEFLISKFGSSDFKNLDENIRKTFINIVNEDLTSYLKDIAPPTLLIWGELDLDTPLKDGKLMNKKIKDSGLVIVPNVGHFAYLENSYFVNRVIIRFLKTFK